MDYEIFYEILFQDGYKITKYKKLGFDLIIDEVETKEHGLIEAVWISC